MHPKPPVLTSVINSPSYIYVYKFKVVYIVTLLITNLMTLDSLLIYLQWFLRATITELLLYAT